MDRPPPETPIADKISARHQMLSTGLLTVGLALGLLLCYFLAIPFLPAIVGSFALAVLFAPLDERLQRVFGSPGIAAAVTVAIVAFIVVVPTIMVVGTLLNEAARSAPFVSAMVDPASWARSLDKYPRLASVLLWINERVEVPQLAQTATSRIAEWSTTLLSGSLSGLVSLLLAFYFLFYMLRDREEGIEAVKRMLPLSAPEFSTFADRLVNTVFASIYGTATVAALQGGLGGAMFWWLGLSAPIFWGVLMGLLALVPFLGAFLIWGPTAIFLLLTGEVTSAALLAVWGTVVVGMVDNVLYPILVGKRLMLHTVPSFIAIVGGLLLFGAPGVVLGPMIVAGSHTLFVIWRERSTGFS